MVHLTKPSNTLPYFVFVRFASISKAISFGTALRTENERFCSGRKTRRTEFGLQPYHDQSVQIVFRQQVITCTGTQQREDGSTMRYAKALPRDFRFFPGLHGARRTGASQPMQKQHGTRDEGNATHTLHARSVVFGCHLFLSLAVSISFINSYLPDGDYPPRPRRGKNWGCATSQLLS